MFAALLTSFFCNPSYQHAETTAFSFGATQYVHRYSKGDLHEFTPKGKPDLKKWTDMVTINDYPTVKTGEALAKSATGVLDAYKEHKAVVVRTDSVPRTAKKEAEHLIVVMFPTADFIEAAFTRLLMADGYGHSIVYSHRIYGKKAGNEMSQWLTKNGEQIEKTLMSMPSVPKH